MHLDSQLRLRRIYGTASISRRQLAIIESFSNCLFYHMLRTEGIGWITIYLDRATVCTCCCRPSESMVLHERIPCNTWSGILSFSMVAGTNIWQKGRKWKARRKHEECQLGMCGRRHDMYTDVNANGHKSLQQSSIVERIVRRNNIYNEIVNRTDKDRSIRRSLSIICHVSLTVVDVARVGHFGYSPCI